MFGRWPGPRSRRDHGEHAMEVDHAPRGAAPRGTLERARGVVPLAALSRASSRGSSRGRLHPCRSPRVALAAHGRLDLVPCRQRRAAGRLAGLSARRHVAGGRAHQGRACAGQRRAVARGRGPKRADGPLCCAHVDRRCPRRERSGFDLLRQPRLAADHSVDVGDREPARVERGERVGANDRGW